MPIYVVQPHPMELQVSYERSPIVVLATDAASTDTIPPTVRSAAERVLTADLSALRNSKVPAGADGVILWLEGDRLIYGSTAAIRRDLLNPGRRCWVPLHLPGTQELDLIAIQPRWFTADAREDFIHLSTRVAGAPVPSAQVVSALYENRQPWARLYLALVKEQQQAGSRIDDLCHLWQETKLPPMLAGLVLRNWVVLAIAYNELGTANELLELGMRAYPGYAELHYLGALLCVRQERIAQALAHLKKATEQFNSDFVGSGGESSYRARWLMGAIGEMAGNQKMAVEYYRVGLLWNPAFRPSVEGLLNQRLPTEIVETLQWELCGLVRREPQYLESVFDYLLLHRAFPGARRMVETLSLPAETRAVLRDRLESAAAPFRRRPRDVGAKPGVILTGPFLVHSSVARINREIGAALMQAVDLDASLEPYEFASAPLETMPPLGALSKGLLSHPKRLDLTIRHRWPPDFDPPSTGKLAVLLHWEYGAVPVKWVEEIHQNVDELWVASNFVRNVFIRGGVDPERVHVIPLGVDTHLYHPDGPCWQPDDVFGFKFLFVGGAIPRKGVDLLLQAYKMAFRPDEDVTLIIKDLGSDSFYKNMTLLDDLNKFAQDPGCPNLAVLTEKLSDARLAGLFRSCDVFVLPYRGEGFGMPILEAMACGKPVVTTALGPAPEFCSSETGYLIPAQVARVPGPPPPLGKFTGPLTWFEPNLEELARTLRHVYQHREEAARRGTVAAQRVRATHSWSRITGFFLDRIHHLVKEPSGEGLPTQQTSLVGTG